MKKKIISIIMVLGLCMGVVIPVTANDSAEFNTVEYQRKMYEENFKEYATLTGSILNYALYSGNYGQYLTVSNVTHLSSIWFEEEGWIHARNAVFATAPVTITALQNLSVVETGNEICRMNTMPESDMRMDIIGNTNYNEQIELTTGKKLIDNEGNYYVEAGATYVLEAGVYWLGTTADEGSFVLIVSGDNTPTESPSSWAVEQVNAAIAENLVPATLQSKYTQATTRAEFCTLAVALYENIKGVITGRSTFTDTNDVNVQKAAFIGVVSGVGDNKFDPNSSLTREQAAVMLARLANAVGKPLTKKAATFADNTKISSWAVEQVGQIQAAGIMGGVGNNTFAPKDPYTREQSIITIMRLFDVVK